MTDENGDKHEAPHVYSFRRTDNVFYMDEGEKSFAFLGGSGLIHFPCQVEARLVAAYMDSCDSTVTGQSFDFTLDVAERWLEFLDTTQDNEG